MDTPRGCWANLHLPLKTAFDYRIPEDEVEFISVCSQSLFFSVSSLISGYINMLVSYIQFCIIYLSSLQKCFFF